jgi:predicted small metal-binding protein
MKKLKCRDLGGPCDTEIVGNSFQEMGNNARTHVMEKIKSSDEAHKAAADKMRSASPEEQKSMMAGAVHLRKQRWQRHRQSTCLRRRHVL